MMAREIQHIRSIIALLIIVAPLLTVAQYNTNFLDYSKTGRSVGVSLDFEVGSSGFTSDLVNKLIWGGYIPNSLKESASKRMRAMNNFGAVIDYDLRAFVKGGKKFDYLIGFKNQEVLNARYTKDFYDLMFYGNDRFRGSVVNLKNCNVNALRFQEIKFGAMIHPVDSVGKIGLSISLIKGEQLFHVQTHNRSTFYTSADGSEVVFNSDFNMAVSDTANRGIGSWNGIGASADIYFETSYKSKLGKRSVLMVNANNIGFIHWRNNSVQYSSDSSLHFSGYRITNITDLKDSTLQRINSDSLLKHLTNAHTEEFNVNIPTNLVIINKVYFGDKEKWSMLMGYRHIFNANYIPYIFFEPEYRIKKVTVALHAGYGGYSRMNVGASFTWNARHVFLRLGSNSLQGFLFPRYSYGQGLFFALAWKVGDSKVDK